MEVDGPQQDFGDFPITLPAAHQSFTLDDLQSFTTGTTNNYNPSNSGSASVDLAKPAGSVHSTGMTSSFPYFTSNDDTYVDFASPSAFDTKNASLRFPPSEKRDSSAYSNLPLSPAHSLVSHSRDSDLYLDGTHGPTTPEEWSTMMPSREKGQAGAWNSGVPPYYDTYSGHDSSSMHVDQFAHLGAGFDSHSPSMGMHQQHDELTLGPSRTSPYPPASSFMPMAHMPLSPASSSPFLNADSHSSIPRGFVHQPSDAFSGLLMPGFEHEHRHSSPSSLTTQDDRVSSSATSSSKRRAARGSRSSAQPPRRASRAGSASAMSKKQELRPYPTPVGSTISMSPGSSQTPECTQCSLTFRDMPALQKHIKSEHTRPLVCVFHYAGCTSRFASKNEWKRHVASQHLALRYWLCTEGTCGQTRGPSTRSRAPTLPSFGSIFNRKDLYTQHIRRMHLPTEAGSPGSKKPLPADYEDRLRELQARAARIRCALPTFMLCPAVNCGTEFHGPNAWDDRMEHVAGHLERAAAGEEPPVVFGGQHDWTLTEWAASDSVQVTRRGHNGDTWTLCNPLRGEGAGSGRSGRASIDSASKARGGTGAAHRHDEDAEGEDWRS